MTDIEAKKKFLKELPFRKITAIQPYKTGWIITAPDKSMSNDDYSGITFFVNSKGIKKLSVFDMFTMEDINK